MRAVVQRVRTATVTVGGDIVGSCQVGLAILLGVAASDDEADADRLAAKIARLRIFENAEGRFDSLLDVAGEALVVSQFTLIADSRHQKGTDPTSRKQRVPKWPSHFTNASSRRFGKKACRCKPACSELGCKSRSSMTGPSRSSSRRSPDLIAGGGA